MKLMIIGMARSGKDEACEYLASKIRFTFKGSSYLAAEIFLYDLLKDELGYQSIEECFNDRHNHRKRWYDEITKFNTPDRTKLARLILEKSDAYVGLRNSDELDQLKREMGDNLLVIWIDSSKRTPPESSDSCTVTIDQADIIVQNNGNLADFRAKLDKLAIFIGNSVVNNA